MSEQLVVRAIAGALVALAWAPIVRSQSVPSDLDSLIRVGLARNPAIRVAVESQRAARARIGPAGAWADPVLGLGVTDLPIARPGFYDDFTMKVARVTQTLPLAGAPSARGRAAEREADAAGYRVDATRLDLIARIKDAYYELAYLDRALAIVRQSHAVLTDLGRASEARYAAGTGSQQDALSSRIAAARLADDAVALGARRSAALAQLNAALDRPSDAPVDSAVVPIAIMHAATPDSAAGVSFVSPALGAVAAHSPLPPLAELEEEAEQSSPELHEHESMIAADAARVELARKERFPDVDVSLEYDQRSGFPDFVTAMVSLPIPIHTGRKQGQRVVEARSQLAADEAQHHASVNDVRAMVAGQYADVERARTELALYSKAVLPQANASLHSATADYQAGRGEFKSVLAAQAAVFEYETNYHRALTDFAKGVAKLERTVGKEILR